MDPAQTDRLLRGLFAAGDPSAEVRAAATRAVPPGTDQPTAGLRLAELGLLTRYQAGKLKHSRLNDLLFGPYLICEKIGEGGMGKVYRAVHMDTGTQVALKVVRPHLMTNVVVQKRYAREAKAAASFDHPNIIKLLAEDTVDGRYFLAMEYIDGSDLSRLVRECGRPPDRGLADPQEACEYVRLAALGLQHAHDRGFVHRDVKPSNLLAYGDRPLPGFAAITGLKILDMGLVRRLMGADDDLSRNDLTRDGTVVGTPDYMSPEQAKNSSAVDGRADLYSLGCTLYFLLHGRPPFDGGSPIDKLLRHHTAAPPDPRAGRPDVAPGLADIILRLMKKNPAERFQSAAAVADALRPYCPGGEPTPVLNPLNDFSLAPTTPGAVDAAAEAPTAELPAAVPRQLRLKVKEPAAKPTRVPAATSGERPDTNTPSDGSLPATRSRTPARGDRSRKRPAGPPSTDRLWSGSDTPASDRIRTVRRSARRKKPVWPWIAGGVAAVLLLGVVAWLLGRNPPTPATSTAPTVPTVRDPVQPAARPVGDAVADRAAAVVTLRPAAFAARLPSGGRLGQFLARLQGQGFAADRLDRVTVSVVGGQGVAVGEPKAGPAAVVGTDATVRDALNARRASGRPPAGLSADLATAQRTAAEGNPVVGFAADGGFALPGGDTLAGGRVRWAAATIGLDGDAVRVALTLAGQDRRELLEFVSLELAGKLATAVPALKPACDKLAAAEPAARRTDAGLELTFSFQLDWPELLSLLEQLLPTE